MGLFPFTQGAGGRNCPPLSAQVEPGTPEVLPALPRAKFGARAPLSPADPRAPPGAGAPPRGGRRRDRHPSQGAGGGGRRRREPRRRRGPPCDLTAPTGVGEPRTEAPVAPGGSYPAAAAVSVLAPRAAPCPPGPRSSRRRWQPPAAVR